MIHKASFNLFMLMGIVLLTSCNPVQISLTAQANIPNPASVYCEQQGNKLEIVTAADGSQNGVCIFPDGSTCDEWVYFRNECGSGEQSGSPSSKSPSDNPTVTVPAHVVINEAYDYCFAYPQGFTQQIYGNQVEVIGPHSGVGGWAGLVWIDVIDVQGRTAQEIADEEVNAFGGSPPRSTVMVGGEEALVLDGMPGQDAIRKVYIVHNGLLYTLNFSPYQSESETANAQMETLFASVTSSWVWMSSGKSCTAAG